MPRRWRIYNHVVAFNVIAKNFVTLLNLCQRNNLILINGSIVNDKQTKKNGKTNYSSFDIANVRDATAMADILCGIDFCQHGKFNRRVFFCKAHD